MVDKLEQKLSEYINGDDSAFGYIYDATYKAVYFTALYIVGQKPIAEDVVQETYYKAIRSLNTYRPGGNFTGWLCQISRNTAMDGVRKRSKETLTDFQTEWQSFGAEEQPVPYVFDVARKTLSDEEYQIVMLCQVAGYKRREVAQMLDMPIGTVTWKNNEALKKLKQTLKEGENER